MHGKYVLYNCLGEVVGRYKTIKGVKIAIAKRHNQLWDLYYRKGDYDVHADYVYKWEEEVTV